MKKKLVFAALSLLLVMSVAACSKKNNEAIATMAGGKITTEDYYDKIKMQQNNQAVLQQMIISKVFVNKFGEKVSSEQVDEQYEKLAKQYGDKFEAQMKAAGLTKKSLKEKLKEELALKEGLIDNMDLTEEDLEKAWENFHPEVQGQLIMARNEEEIDQLKEEVSQPEADFGEIAKNKSADTTTKNDGGAVTFDSKTQTVPEAVKKVAFALQEGEISEPIEVKGKNNQGAVYYLVKLVKKQEKGDDREKFKKEVTEAAQDTKLNDQNFVTQTISKELKAANVKMKDSDLSDVLAKYMSKTKESS